MPSFLSLTLPNITLTYLVETRDDKFLVHRKINQTMSQKGLDRDDQPNTLTTQAA